MRRVPAGIHPYLKSLAVSATLAGGGLLRRLPSTSRSFGPPRHFARTLAEYCDGRPDASYVELHPREIICRSLPDPVEGTIHSEFWAELSRLSPEVGVAAIARGRVLTRSGAVIGPDDCLISEISAGFLSDDPRGNEIFLSLKLPPVTRVAGSIGVVTTPSSGNYFHWIFDTLPRLLMLEESGFDIDRVVVPRRSRFQRESLDLLGLGPDRVIDTPGEHIEAETLVVPTMPGLSGNPPRWACDFLRESFLADLGSETSRRRIYVSRQKCGTRMVLNEAELVNALRIDGFEVFYLEELSFADQVRLFAEAEIVVSAHGAGLSNLVFCPRGAGLVELFSPGYVNVCYWAVANQIGVDYRYVLGEARQSPGGKGAVHENIFVDITKVRAALRSLR
jgi:capsular polysaccharide biosynthesis protein